MLVHRYPALVPASQPDTDVRIGPAMWRRLLTEPLLPPRSAVLIAGQRPVEAAELLIDLAYDVSCLCVLPDAVLAGRQSCPKADFELWSQEGWSDSQRHFDLILAMDWQRTIGTLESRGSRDRLRNLLFSLNPGSRLVLLSVGDWRAEYATTGDLIHHQLPDYPGAVSTSLLTDLWGGRWPWTMSAPQILRPVTAFTLVRGTNDRAILEWVEAGRSVLFDGRRAA